jgi:hypothetical protein
MAVGYVASGSRAPGSAPLFGTTPVPSLRNRERGSHPAREIQRAAPLWWRTSGAKKPGSCEYCMSPAGLIAVQKSNLSNVLLGFSLVQLFLLFSIVFKHLISLPWSLPLLWIDRRMAPLKPGGRPKNAWNSSRRRKLVRLYTLTHLSTVEIGKVLKADDFNPW